ncbi:right-handed parallel beta-helix repeat-containing protein [Paenibacillus tarimensis]|uniref:right-handed parallel beta-helix repeat-containing protein n=1 Tax=Paenibacillus tarimensis TaxID=416012 RepID=UPI001F4889B7|nr:right-handed parallel beta-helix repeat-containing protein [Paenibacillus tarimensis]MCF2944650.1 right-handed parallel beta-helix repeat-containing protein [Paenibacillus tarimensis]
MKGLKRLYQNSPAIIAANTSNPAAVKVLLAMLALVLAAALYPQVSHGSGVSYYVSTAGSDSNSGKSLSYPLLTINKAVSLVKPGDTIYVRSGTYRLTKTIDPTVSGTAASRITLRSYGGERVVVDAAGANGGRAGTKAIRLSGVSYWTISKIHVTKSPGIGISIQNGAHDNRIDSLDIYSNGGTGMQLETNAYNNYINAVNSYLNYDPPYGEHADGFANKAGARNNTFNRCKAWNNSDDGWDFWGGGYSQISKSEAFNNGYNASGVHYPEGDGTGFKLGGQSAGGWSGSNTVRNSAAYNNYGSGFLWNNATMKNMLYNTTAYNNNRGKLSYAYNYRFENGDVIRNSVSAGTGGVRLADNVNQSSNSWNLGLAGNSFASIDPKSKNFLYLISSSPLIDKGVQVGMAYTNKAPDLGAFEFGAEWR